MTTAVNVCEEGVLSDFRVRRRGYRLSAKPRKRLKLIARSADARHVQGAPSDRERAFAPLYDARRLFEELGMTGWIRRAGKATNQSGLAEGS